MEFKALTQTKVGKWNFNKKDRIYVSNNTGNECTVIITNYSGNTSQSIPVLVNGKFKTELKKLKENKDWQLMEIKADFEGKFLFLCTEESLIEKIQELINFAVFSDKLKFSTMHLRVPADYNKYDSVQLFKNILFSGNFGSYLGIIFLLPYQNRFLRIPQNYIEDFYYTIKQSGLNKQGVKIFVLNKKELLKPQDKNELTKYIKQCSIKTQ